MAQSLEKLEKQRTARRTWRVRVPEDLDDRASRAAKKEGIPKSAIIRYLLDTATAEGRKGAFGTHE